MTGVMRTLGRHSLIYGSGLVLGRALGFLLLPLYTRHLTPEDYGVIELLDLLSFVMGTFAALGMEQAIMRYYHAYTDPRERQRVLSTAVLFGAVSGLVVTLVLIPMRGVFALYMLGSERYADLTLLSFVTLFTTSLLALEKTVLRAQQRSVMFTIVTLVHTGIALVLNVYFIAIRQVGPAGIFYSTIIVSTLFCVYLTWRIFRETGVAFDVEKLRAMLGYGIYFVPAGLAALLLNWGDRYFLRMYGTLEMVGVYALAYKISMIIVAAITQPFKQIWHSYLFELQHRPDAREIYAQVATYFLLLLSGAGLGIAMLSREIVIVMAAPEYLAAHTIIPILVLAMVLFSSDHVFQVGLLIKGESGKLSTARWIAAGSNVGLNWLLIPPYGMMGAAVATLISFIVSSGFILIAAQRTYLIPFEYRRLAKVGAVSLVVYAAAAFVPALELWVSVILKLAIWLAFPALLLVMRFLTPPERAAVGRMATQAQEMTWRRLSISRP